MDKPLIKSSNQKPKEIKPRKIQEIERVKKYFYYRFAEKLNKKQAALKAGYTESESNCVLHTIEKRKFYEYLIRIALPEDDLLNILRRNIFQEKNIEGSNRGLDMAFKLKNLYPKEQRDENIPELKLIVRQTKQG